MGASQATSDPARTMVAAGGSWSAAQAVRGLPRTDGQAGGEGLSVSCAAPGDCVAGGSYEYHGSYGAFVVSQRGGVWGRAIKVATALNTGGVAAVTAVSCPSPGNCSVAGYYDVSSRFDDTLSEASNAFVVSEVKGSWGRAKAVPGLAALNVGGAAAIDSLSCRAPGYCTAGGSYALRPVPYVGEPTAAFVVTETRGVWGKAKEIAPAGDASVNSVSCFSPGDCAAGGSYYILRSPGDGIHAFVADEARGLWGRVKEVPGTAALNVSGQAAVTSVSCVPDGDCAAGGYYAGRSGARQAFVVDESGGVWGKAKTVAAALNAGGNAQISSVSCGSAGNCAAGGYYTDPARVREAFVISRSGRTWGKAEAVMFAPDAAGGAAVTSVACASAGNCAAGGSYAYVPGSVQAFVVDEVRGSWARPQEVSGTTAPISGGSAAVNAISCSSSGRCVATGYYGNEQPFVAEQARATRASR